MRAEAFDGLNQSLEKAWQKLKGEANITQENVKEPLRDIRRALLEADVSLPVVRRFVKRVEEKAVGADVTVGVKPDQQLVKIVSDQLVELMGSEATPLAEKSRGTTVVLMAGLQGVGKTLGDSPDDRILKAIIAMIAPLNTIRAEFWNFLFSSSWPRNW